MLKLSQQHYLQRLERMRKMIEIRLEGRGGMPDVVIATEAMVLVSSFNFPLRERWKLLQMLFRGNCRCLVCGWGNPPTGSENRS